MTNIPELKLGIISVSRSCFPITLSEKRRSNVVRAFGEGLYECPICVENDVDARKAVDDVVAHGVNALCVFLGNFGPETMIADWFDGPIMYTSAAEGDGDLHDGRGDAYCGMLNASYNLGLRGKRVYIPDYPCATAEKAAQQIREFAPIATALIGLKGLKIFAFGPRPNDFLACNAPIKALYDLGVAVEEHAELDLLVAYNKHKDDPRIPAKMAEMVAEAGNGESKFAGILPRLAQYELTLEDWMAEHLGTSKYAAFANKCWPAFQTEFGFVPCYVNSRLTGRGIPVSCEVDIYGALSEYIGICVSGSAVTLLDINNSVPASMYEESIAGKVPYRHRETFMGFHCGNTCPSPTSPVVPWKATSRPVTSPSSVSSPPRRPSCAHTLHRVSCWTFRPSPSVLSVSLQSPRWIASAVMCSSKSSTRITVRLPSVTTERHCLRSLSTSV